MAIMFEDTLQQLFTQLGLEYPDEIGTDAYPALVVDAQLIIHFTDRQDRVEMVTSLGGLPHQTQVLVKLLTLNYSDAPFPICFASDADGNDLLAIIRLPVNTTPDLLFAALQALVRQIESYKTEMEESRPRSNIAEILLRV